eukprot:CAMPEP_0206275004 /NCGR_PEP_ID=MMETSP0047_2-20121206/35477_1 /ASSEMBLY_ACC=CAM_ASM_000192 /TAXON_ID=195065 /ORGANISM="Chroomonas mesostigmatica_cf, Strain CCMP1168" /LENGTH=643 /DNA_ID=CAMNT_0053704297 /DNA_START=26 /DNA_END=1957 /DNA_ORIENTATION=-
MSTFAKYMAVAEAWWVAFNRLTHGTNWYRMAFIFLPAIIRGEIFSSMSLYLPFIFGWLLRRSTKQCGAIFESTDDVYVNLKISRAEYISWVWKSILELVYMLLFLGVCHYMKAETRILVNFFIASFVCPMIRAAFPQPQRGPIWKGKPLWDETLGELLVHVFIVSGLALSWGFQGMDQLFLGLLFLQAIPAVQERFWFKPTQHGYLVLVIVTLCMPFFSVGITSRFFPSYLDYFPKPFLRVLCMLANVTPRVKDYYQVLGLSRDADMKMIRRVFRQLSLELHPDKVGDDPIALARFNEVREASDALTKQRAAYDKAIENQELNEMAPRCEAFMIMMYFWILHALIDWVQIEDAIIAMKKQLRQYILQDRKLDTKSFGIEPEADARAVLKKYCEVGEDVELPSLPPRQFTTGSREDIDRMRQLLTGVGQKIEPFIEVKGMVDKVSQEFVLATASQFKELGGISSTDGYYNRWIFEIEGKDVLTGEVKKGSSKVQRYNGTDHVVTLETDLGWEPEPGKAKFTITKESGMDWVKGVIGYHVYPHRNQVLMLGEGLEDGRFQWKLRDQKNFYAGYKIEFRNGEDFVGWQRVHEYFPVDKKVILKGPMALSSSVQPEAGKTSYKMFPDQIIPQNCATPKRVDEEDERP